MACFVQIFTYTTVYSKIKDKKKLKNKNISLPTENRLIFFLSLDIESGKSKNCTGTSKVFRGLVLGQA